jgi:hypothetical protein
VIAFHVGIAAACSSKQQASRKTSHSWSRSPTTMVEIDPTFVLAFQKSKVPNRPLALILHLSDFETFVPSIFQQQTRQNNKI